MVYEGIGEVFKNPWLEAAEFIRIWLSKHTPRSWAERLQTPCRRFTVCSNASARLRSRAGRWVTKPSCDTV